MYEQAKAKHIFQAILTPSSCWELVGEMIVYASGFLASLLYRQGDWSQRGFLTHPKSHSQSAGRHSDPGSSHRVLFPLQHSPLGLTDTISLFLLLRYTRTQGWMEVSGSLTEILLCTLALRCSFPAGKFHQTEVSQVCSCAPPSPIPHCPHPLSKWTGNHTWWRVSYLWGWLWGQEKRGWQLSLAVESQSWGWYAAHSGCW